MLGARTSSLLMYPDATAHSFQPWIHPAFANDLNPAKVMFSRQFMVMINPCRFLSSGK